VRDRLHFVNFRQSAVRGAKPESIAKTFEPGACPRRRLAWVGDPAPSG